MSAAKGVKPWPFVFIVATVFIFVALIILIIRGSMAIVPGSSLPPASQQALTEGEKLAILNQLNSGGGSVGDRQSEVDKLSASAPAI